VKDINSDLYIRRDAESRFEECRWALNDVLSALPWSKRFCDKRTKLR